MGPEQSIQAPGGPQFARPYQSDIYMPVSGGRSSMDRTTVFGVDTEQKMAKNPSNKLIKSAFNGVWSIHNPIKIGPESRTGHFFVNDELNRCCYIGDGILQSGETTFDLWKVSLDTLEWTKIPLYGLNLAPRTGEKAVLYKGVIIVFGGYSEPNYLTDLHAINPQTGEIKMLESNGELPAPRSSPIMEVVNGKVYMWGGFNGNWIDDLNVLDLSTMQWSFYPQNVSGRTNIPSIVFGNHILSYGGSKAGGLLDIDTTTNIVSIVQTSGQAPPPKAMGGGMVLIGDLAVYLGGKTEFQGSLVYACNLSKNWWFVFHVLPDGETVSVEDGFVSDLGLFMIPKFNSFSAVYDEKERSILTFLGEPHALSPVINKIHIANALAHINLREDMISVLNLK